MKKEDFSKEIFLRDVMEISAQDHYLRNEFLPDNYLDDLYEVLSFAYRALSPLKFKNLIEKKLQMKMLKFDEAQFIQNACELSAIANYMCNEKYIFSYEKAVTGKKDVDFSLEVEGRIFNVEVKCSSYKGRTTTSIDGQIQIHFIDRAPTSEIRSTILDNISQKLAPNNLSIKEEKNLDNVLKDFLISTQGKVKDAPLEDVNILLICCDDELDMHQWRHHLFGPNGFFTDRSQCSPEDYDRVDFILLTNLYNRHARPYEGKVHGNRWSLADAFCLLYPNRFSIRNESSSDCINEFSEMSRFFQNHSRNFESYFLNDEVPHGESLDMKKMCLAISFFSDNLKLSGKSYFKERPPSRS